MKIVMATSECAPFIKSGGLADVVGSLPQAFVEMGHDCTVVLPLYADLKCREDLEYVTSYDIYLGWRKKHCGVFTCEKNGVRFYFIDNEEYFKRPGLYGYDDDNLRYAYFDFAVLELISHLQLEVNILHMHDWQTAMIAPLYREKYSMHPYYANIKLVFTIHNIAYQGKAAPSLVQSVFGLSESLYTSGNLRNDDCFNMMKGAILYSDIITTVSPTYAQEILTNEYGEGLQHILELRKGDLYGILNGIDYVTNNPTTDPALVENFDLATIESKYVNKVALQKEVGLVEDKDIPLIGIVTRLTWQKGVSLILEQIHTLMERDVQVVLLGAGDFELEQQFNQIDWMYPGKLSLNMKYDFGLSCRIYGGCDMFLMPSLFEPCGLSQMMSMRYGTIPIVRETGGLKDSVTPYNEFEKTGTGFSFTNYNSYDMMHVIDYALEMYDDKDQWNSIIENAMTTNLDWNESAKTYISIFENI
ncbi:glycogen synthase GlgA [Tannockella kyphosi]|uniref:glycogen synthase GlgA n=1 Tax=Tannockella kyphosi TaxID=2899121 RepID=UPI0020123B9D|nr:glycogen synthase GlgA [Tannockella kyphosi]